MEPGTYKRYNERKSKTGLHEETKIIDGKKVIGLNAPMGKPPVLTPLEQSKMETTILTRIREEKIECRHASETSANLKLRELTKNEFRKLGKKPPVSNKYYAGFSQKYQTLARKLLIKHMSQHEKTKKKRHTKRLKAWHTKNKMKRQKTEDI